MNVLVTGALGNVGKSTVRALLALGDRVTAFEADSPGMRRKARKFERSLHLSGSRTPGAGRDRSGMPSGMPDGMPLRFVFGDIRDAKALEKALAAPEGVVGTDTGDMEAVCHLAAVIPPAADKVPGLADSVNTGGTAALIAACKNHAAKGRYGATGSSGTADPAEVRIILASSIAIYGDRLASPWISASDPPAPDDVYGHSKLECERLLRASGLPWTILRLTYIVSPGWIKPDPMLFDMPVSTRIEICHTEDAGRAFAAAAHCAGAKGRILDIGGGVSCRTTFRAYLDRIFRCFGLGGSGFLPDSAFARGNFHCGWYMDSDESEALLGFRSKSLEDYYSEVAWKTRTMRFLTPVAAPFVRGRMLASSPYFGT